MNSTCDCIVPFFNEGSRVLHVVDTVSKFPFLSRIIVVDDGSTDTSAFLKLKKDYPDTILLRLEKNSGKANAVKEGIKQVKAEYILLLDGDLTNIRKDELDNAVHTITSNSAIDMIILRRVDDVTSNAWARQDIITSGQRILKTEDLRQVFNGKFESYQLEVAINAYMMRYKKKAYWIPFSIHGPLRTQKWGWKYGIRMFFVSFFGYFRYHLFGEFIRQTLFFCRREAVPFQRVEL